MQRISTGIEIVVRMTRKKTLCLLEAPLRTTHRVLLKMPPDPLRKIPQMDMVLKMFPAVLMMVSKLLSMLVEVCAMFQFKKHL
jgi:hypothetical protein